MNSEFKPLSVFKSSLYSDIKIPFDINSTWKLLSDFTDYKQWNPILYPISGTLEAGNTVEIQLNWPDLKPNQYKLSILQCDNFCISWLGHLMIPNLMDGHHSFVLESISSDSTLLIQKETFSGLFVPIMNPWLKKNIQQGFIEINQAFKAHCENSLNKTT